jgi:hypothetical protein
MFFSEEKNQKTFVSGAVRMVEAMAGGWAQRRRLKVFCFFSSEKKSFFPFS